MRVIRAGEESLGDIIKLNKLFSLDFDWFIWDSQDYVENELRNNAYYVLKDYGRVHGAMCLKMNGDEAFIETIAVDRKKQRNGLGRKLIEFAKEFSQMNGKSKLIVESFCDYDLKDFYQKCGFICDPKKSYYEGYPYFSFSMKL